MTLIELDGGQVLGQGPLDLVVDSGEHGDDVLALAEEDNGEIAARELDAVVLVDQVEDGAGDGEDDLFDGLQWGRGGNIVILRE